MRRLLIVALLVGAAMPVPATAPSLTITELLPDPGEGREFIELHATYATNITGWSIEDAAGQRFTFGDTELSAGQRIVVWGGGASDAVGPAWNRATVWNNGGDQAILRDASGAIVDVFAYGTATWPDERDADVPAAPGTGMSLQQRDGRWVHANPTPGADLEASGGSASATVENVAPTATLQAPATAAPDGHVQVVIGVEDGNGDAVTWTLHHGDTTQGQGNDTLSLTAPTTGPWTLRLIATDTHGAETSVERTVHIDAGGLVVELPESGLVFPPLRPGMAVAETAPFTLRNTGAEALRPSIDVSDLTGPGRIPVAEHLVLIHNGTAISYGGPLTALPELPPGAAVDVALRLVDLPVPLPAGDYATSFAVIA